MLLDWRTCERDEWLRHIISIHFNPSFGTPYWLRKESELRISAINDIRSAEDLHLLGKMNEENLSSFPVEDFIPRCFLKNRASIFTAESGGTTGVIKTTAYRTDEFKSAFSGFFRAIAVKRDFPGHLNWLFAGPSGPHIIHRSAVEMAVSLGAMQPFSIDFDPRWAKKFDRDSMPFSRYKAHVVEQALRIINTQDIGILFSTPDIAADTGESLAVHKRDKIRGIHLGGLPLIPDTYKKLEDTYPNAVIIPGYGNTLLGLTLETEPHDEEYNAAYYPPGSRLIIEICDISAETEGSHFTKVDFGERGRVVAHRLDETFFIPNLVERDSAIRLKPREVCTSPGILQEGFKNPMPAKDYATNTIQEGLY